MSILTTVFTAIGGLMCTGFVALVGVAALVLYSPLGKTLVAKYFGGNPRKTPDDLN